MCVIGSFTNVELAIKKTDWPQTGILLVDMVLKK